MSQNLTITSHFSHKSSILLSRQICDGDGCQGRLRAVEPGHALLENSPTIFREVASCFHPLFAKVLKARRGFCSKRVSLLWGHLTIKSSRGLLECRARLTYLSLRQQQSPSRVSRADESAVLSGKRGRCLSTPGGSHGPLQAPGNYEVLPNSRKRNYGKLVCSPCLPII